MLQYRNRLQYRQDLSLFVKYLITNCCLPTICLLHLGLTGVQYYLTPLRIIDGNHLVFVVIQEIAEGKVTKFAWQKLGDQNHEKFDSMIEFKNRLTNNHVIAITVGLVYIWFGILKFFPQLSPAEELAKGTINALTIGLVSSNISYLVLAIWEVSVGILLILNFYRRAAILLALVHLVFTFTPFFIFPEQLFPQAPLGLSIVGQYIIKNIVIIGALWTLYRIPATTEAFDDQANMISG